MQAYQHTWNYFSSAQFVPEDVRATCESWYEEMVSSQPMQQTQLTAISGNIPEEYAYLLTA